MTNWASVLYHSARKNADRRNISFELTRAQFDSLVERANGRCEVSGVVFNLVFTVEGQRRPFAPSLDRIDSSKGYTIRNCRIVCVLVNLALNEWGLEPLLIVARNLVVRENELREQMHSKKRWQGSGYITVKDYLISLNVEFTVSDQRIITKRAKALCEYEDIDYANVKVQVGKARKDGSYLEELRPAFPIGVLERLVAVNMQEGDGTGV